MSTAINIGPSVYECVALNILHASADSAWKNHRLKLYVSGGPAGPQSVLPLTQKQVFICVSITVLMFDHCLTFLSEVSSNCADTMTLRFL